MGASEPTSPMFSGGLRGRRVRAVLGSASTGHDQPETTQAGVPSFTSQGQNQMAPQWYTHAQKRAHDMRLGWIARQKGWEFDPTETVYWQEGYQMWPEPLRHPPTMSQEMSQIQKRSLT